MSLAKAAPKIEPRTTTPIRANAASQDSAARFTNQRSPSLRAVEAGSPAKREKGLCLQARVPVIVGEATYRGLMPIDGVISGQLNENGGTLTIKQHTRRVPSVPVPELDGEITFKGMVRVNGHIAGRVFSQKGTFIVSESAKVDACVEVAVAVISGTVNGDVVGHERVELGPCAIINGNISTRALIIKPGAIFHGECRMLKNRDNQADRSK